MLDSSDPKQTPLMATCRRRTHLVHLDALSERGQSALNWQNRRDLGI